MVSISGLALGYASWVILQTNSADAGTINVTADNVSDRRLLIENAAVGTDNSINFGPKANDSSGTIQNGGTTAEDMTFNFTFDLFIASADVNGSVTSYLSLSEGSWSTDYILAPISFSSAAQTTLMTVTSGVPSASSYTSSGTTGRDETFAVTLGTPSTTSSFPRTYTGCSVSVTLDWGSYFGYHNPSDPEDYFGGGNQPTIDDVISALNTIYGYNNKALTVHLATTVS